jgi:catechol 2,3-dioxygenase-like lactoylglutathione lyase family enzyme
MTMARLEHVNFSVSDVEKTALFLERLTGWHRRWEGPSINGGYTIHLGGDDAYVSIYSNPAVAGGFAKGAPMNHIGIAVDDLAAAEKLVAAEGFEPFNHSTYDPGPRSFYFFDSDGIEFEVVQYETPPSP